MTENKMNSNNQNTTEERGNSSYDSEGAKQRKMSLPLAGHMKKMLVAGDDERDRIVLQNFFKNDFTIETASGGREAMIRLQHFRGALSVVLLDMSMSDGYEVLEKMQESIDLCTIPVIIISEENDYEYVGKALKCGAADFVTKPLDLRILSLRVQSVVSKAGNEKSRVQNSYLQLQREEEMKLRTVLESTGTVVVEYDWHNKVFFYENNISQYLAGNYSNGRSLWMILLSDMIADSNDVKKLQELIAQLTMDRTIQKVQKKIMLKTPSQMKHWFRVNVYKKTDQFGLADRIVLTFNDIHDEVLAEEKLRFQAMRDELTGLYNRNGFLEKAAEMIEQRESGYYVLSCVDIERFRVINDQYGAEKGDEVLIKLGKVLETMFGSRNSLCGRITADNFVVLHPVREVSEPKEIQRRLTNAMHDSTLPPLKFCIGHCIADDKELRVSAIYDRAMLAKEKAKGRFDISTVNFDESMRTGLLHQQKIISQMNAALQQKQFEIWFQPQFNHSTGALCGAEALVRWRHPQEGLIPPGEFIPIFERNGFVYEVDKYVWRSCCKRLRYWLDNGMEPVPVSVNISRYDVFRDDIIQVISGLIKEYRLSVDLLRLEITESAFAESAGQIISVTKQFINLGFTVEIDDFGSGYSSLNTLKDVPAQVLKMDMRFFEKNGVSERGGSIVESIVRMSRWIGMTVIAEGVETIEQAEYLKSIGCETIQGYLYSKPLPMKEYEDILLKSKKEPEFAAIQLLETWDSSAFWNPHSMETLIFNSYVGGACIFEYYHGETELLRINERYNQEMGAFCDQEIVLNKSTRIPYLNEKNREIVIQNIQKAISTRKESSCDIQLTDPEHMPNHSEYIRVTVRVLAQAEERYLLYGVVCNITEQREAERREMESNRQLSVIMSNINGGVSALLVEDDATTVRVFCNDRYYSLYGYTAAQAEAEQLDVFTRIMPEDMPYVMEQIRRLKKDKMPLTIDYRCIKRDGKRAYLRANCSLMTMEGYGEVITSVVIDITEQRELNDKFRAVVENINGGVSATYLHEDKPEYLIVNNQYFNLLGYTKEQFESEVLNVYDLIHPDDRERVKREVRESYQKQGQYTMEYRVRRRDGEWRYVLCTTNIINLFGVDDPVQLAVSNDITAEMEANELLLFLNETAHDMLAQSDSNQAIHNTLEKLRHFFNADRCYVIEIDHERKVTDNTYEVCAQAIESEKDNLHELPFTEDDYWYEALNNQEFLIIKDTEQLEEQDLKELLLSQNISSMILAPILRNSILAGFIGVDNPKKSMTHLKRLAAVGDYIGILLTRRDLAHRIEEDARMLQELPIQLLDNLPGGAALYEYNEGAISVIHINKRYWKLVGREAQSYDQIAVLDVIHPDDRMTTIQEIEVAMRQNRDAFAIIRILCGDSVYRTFHVTANIGQEQDGKRLLYVSYVMLD